MAEGNAGRAAAGVGNCHGIAEAFVAGQGRDVSGVLPGRMAGTRRGRFTHAAPIHTQNTVGVLKVSSLLLPVIQIRAPTVNEDQLGLAPILALDLIVQFGSVFGSECRHHVLLVRIPSYHIEAA